MKDWLPIRNATPLGNRHRLVEDEAIGDGILDAGHLDVETLLKLRGY
jgi:hypothetical protein